MIQVKNITKSFMTKQGRHYLFKDLNFTIEDKQSVGLLGRNGAGKSTLLRIICGLDEPDSGEVITNSTISWPVGVGGGFQGSLTGRQNVRFVCRLYSSGNYIDEKIRFVEEFADIGKYFDMPVKSYSSGMRSRLTFGLSLAFDFDYYMLDEVSAVGDAAFRKRSEEVLQARREQSGFLVVSHNLGDIERNCDLAIVLMDQTAHVFENVKEAIEVYNKHVHQAKK
ncbi:ABC transporter ATP-binding protein [Moraxella canis]|uniref:ABC transporter ATP-binding protein n=1 Tax=Moraxella canis TaxID=90239 RepID=A0A1S9ZG61_9GAMM|nr:ABC transporter ATP-binding protein [Moraxella canis]